MSDAEGIALFDLGELGPNRVLRRDRKPLRLREPVDEGFLGIVPGGGGGFSNVLYGEAFPVGVLRPGIRANTPYRPRLRVSLFAAPTCNRMRTADVQR